MDLVLNPSFKPDPYAKGIDPSLYAKGVVSADGIAEKVPNTIAELICSVQPMTKHPLESVKVDFEPVAVQGKPSLMEIYTDGMWPSYKDTHGGLPITSIHDVELVFEDLVKATRYFIKTTMGLSIESVYACASSSIATLHLDKQIVRTIKECVIPAVAVQTVMHPFDVDLLATAVRLRACDKTGWNKTGWNMPWEVFVSKLQGIVVKCDEENNTPEDVEQGKLNVEVVLPPDHVDLSFVIGPEGADPAETTPQEPGEAHKKSMKKFVEKLVKANPELLTNTEGFDGPIVDPSPEASAAFKSLTEWVTGGGNDNQPVPCDPPEPSKPLAVTKVPAIDEHGNKVAAPGPGWWLSDDCFCWHPPLKEKWSEKAKQEADALGLITALDHPSVVLDSMGIKGVGELVTDRPKDPIFIAPYLPLYTTPPIIPVDLQKKMGVSVGGHGTVGPDGKVEDHKVTGAWPVTGANPITKSVPFMPSPNADAAVGFNVGNVWYNTVTGELYVCVDNAVAVAKWNKIAQVKPTPEGPKLIITGKPQHLVDLENQMIEGMKGNVFGGPFEMTFDEDQLGKPVTATYTDHSSDKLQEHWSPEAEKDLQQAMVEEIKKQIDADIVQAPVVGFQMPGAPPNTVVMQPMASPGHANENGDVFQKVPDSIAGMSDVALMQEAFSKAAKIPKHLLHGKVHNSR